MKIAVDTLGSDLGSQPIVQAILDFLAVNKDVEIIAFGKKEELALLEGKCEIVDAREVVPMEAGPFEVLHLKNSSMCQAVKATKEKGYDAVISAGSTGGFLSAATLTLKLLPGIKRAALVSPFPTFIKGKKMVVLDIGASNENSAEELYQFAIMGQLYSKAVFNTAEPKTYLLSNGTEDHKGSPVIQEANKLFKERNMPGFMGNKEARNALDGTVDVLVCDGFTGNVFLKSNEGMAKWMGNMMKKAFKKNLWSKLGYLHVKKGINEISETMDYKSTGGAMLLGVNSVVVKSHGNSDAYSFFNGLRVAKAMVDAKVNEKIKEGLLANE